MKIKQIKKLTKKLKIKLSKIQKSQFYLSSFILGSISGAIFIGLLAILFFASGIVNLPEGGLTAEAAAYLRFKEIKENFIPSGVPDVYGHELNISFDEVQDAINKVRIFGPTYSQEEEKITLSGADLERYINIGSQTACKYCCGVKTLVREDGEAACGCAHSIMMRGLAAYLITNHPELSDEQILEELNTWRTSFFPKQTLSAHLQELVESGEAGIEEILEEFPDFLPQMVGGC